MPSLAFLNQIGVWEILLVAIVGLLIFGRRLPEVGRNLGKGIIEFKKGLSGVEDDIKKAGEPPRDEPRQLTATRQASAEEELRTENERLRAQVAEKDSRGA